MTEPEIRGRFLPSRTYARWRWTLRFGLMIVPLVILIFGAIELYLTPSKYRSVCVFSVNHGPKPEEIIALAKSRSVTELTVDRLGLQKVLDCDKEMAAQAVTKNLTIKAISGTQLIELAVVFSRKEAARDIAEEIPKCVVQHLTNLSQQEIETKNKEFAGLIGKASDVAAQKAADLANLLKVHGNQPADLAAQQALERMKRASILADAEVERLGNLRVDAEVHQLKSLPSLELHSKPVIGDHAHSPNVGEELGTLVVKSLVCGLIAALILPYFLEFVFPPNRPAPKVNPVIDL